jgi:prolipoprotein diacylglyceryl transferase
MIQIGIDPIIFSIGSFVVRWYGLMIDIAVITVVVWALRAVQKSAKLNYDTILNGALVGVPSGLVFSRVLHIIDQWQYFASRPLSQLLSGEGLTIYGAVLGAALGLWVYSKWSRFQFGILADIIAPATILGQAIGRVGCILNGCCYGLVTDLPWSIVYTNTHSYGYLASSNLAEGFGRPGKDHRPALSSATARSIRTSPRCSRTVAAPRECAWCQTDTAARRRRWPWQRGLELR